MKLVFLLLFISLKLTAQTVLTDSIADAKALYQQGILYKDGIGVKIDHKQAYHFFKKAATLGDPQVYRAMEFIIKKQTLKIRANFVEL